MRKVALGLLLILALCGAGQAAPDDTARATEINELYHKAKAEFDGGDYKDAVHDFEIVHSAAPSHQTTLMYLGIGYKELGDYPHSESTFKTLLRLAPHMTQAHAQLADLYIRQKQWNEARAQVTAIQDYDPQNTSAHYILGNIAYTQGHLGEATSEWQKTVETWDEDAPAYHNLGWAYFEAHEFNLAEVQFQRAIQIKPHNAMYEFALGYVAWVNNETSKATNMFDLVRQDGATSCFSLTATALQSLRSKNVDDAIQKATEATKTEPDMTQGWVVLAKAYQQKGDLADARQAAEKAAATDPNDWETQKLLQVLPEVTPSPSTAPSGSGTPASGWITPSSSPTAGWTTPTPAPSSTPPAGTPTSSL